MTRITATNLQAATGCSPVLAATYAGPMDDACRLFDIDNPRRVAAFVAQVAHESDLFTATEERLNYSAEGLARTWPARYSEMGRPAKDEDRDESGPRKIRPNALALQLHRNPQAIANHTYANRMGNGSPESGDGWRYRGRGLIQLTGKANYEAIGEVVRGVDPDAPDFVANQDAVKEPRWSAMAAAAFWSERGLNELADAKRFRDITRRINGGEKGMDHRLKLYRRALAAFGA